MMEWVSIRKSMPPVGMEFLASNKSGIAICEMKILAHAKYEINISDAGVSFPDMTHWMFLPEKPYVK